MLLFSTTYAAGQDQFVTDRRTFYGGIVAGANFSALDGDVYGGFHKAGLNVGGMVSVRWKLFRFSGEMLYSQKGCRGVREIYSNYVGEMFERYYVNLNYVEVPVVVSVHTNPFLNFGGGISYSRLISSREWIESDQPYYIDNSIYRFKPNDWAFIASANLLFKKNWAVTLRYQRSFKSIRDPYWVPHDLGSGLQYNSYFTLRLVYLIL